MSGPLAALLAVLLAALGATLPVALGRGNVAAAVNALVALAFALLSFAATVGFPPSSGDAAAAALPLWVTVAGLLHSIGMLGPYDGVWWWDHLTHTTSAALVAALVYAGVVVAVDAGGPALSPAGVAAVTVGYTFAVGVFWELVELVARAVGERYDVDPVLVHYGWRDTALDLAFDLLGAVVVVALDLRPFVDVAARVPGLTRAALGWAGGAVVVGSGVMVLFLGVTGRLGDWRR
jgi:hypothetical protein